MTTFLKLAGSFVLGSIFAAGAIASPAIDRAFDLPEWSENCALPSVTASSPITCDNDVRLASDNEPIPVPSDSDNRDLSGGCGGCRSSQCDGSPQCTCCCCPPTCYASIGAVILHRDRPDAGAIIAANPALTPFSTGRDFDF